MGRWAAAVGGGGDMRRRAANRFAVCSEDRRPIGAKPWAHGTFHWSRRFAAPMPAICERHVSRDLKVAPAAGARGTLGALDAIRSARETSSPCPISAESHSRAAIAANCTRTRELAAAVRARRARVLLPRRGHRVAEHGTTLAPGIAHAKKEKNIFPNPPGIRTRRMPAASAYLSRSCESVHELENSGLHP